jgi:hypothetical protein
VSYVQVTIDTFAEICTNSYVKILLLLSDKGKSKGVCIHAILHVGQ